MQRAHADICDCLAAFLDTYQWRRDEDALEDVEYSAAALLLRTNSHLIGVLADEFAKDPTRFVAPAADEGSNSIAVPADPAER